MKIYFDFTPKDVFIFGGRQEGKTIFGKKLAKSYGKQVYYCYSNNITKINLEKEQDYVLVLDEINYSEPMMQELSDRLSSKAFKVIHILNREKKYPPLGQEINHIEIFTQEDYLKQHHIVSSKETEDKSIKNITSDKEVFEITDKTKKLLNELKELEESLKNVRVLNKKYTYGYNSKLTDELEKAILYKNSDILRSLNLTR